MAYDPLSAMGAAAMAYVLNDFIQANALKVANLDV